MTVPLDRSGSSPRRLRDETLSRLAASLDIPAEMINGLPNHLAAFDGYGDFIDAIVDALRATSATSGGDAQ